MKSWRVTVLQERWLALASRFRARSDAPIFSENIGGWRSVRLISRCVFFVLGGVAAVMILSISHVLHAPSLVIPGLLLIGAGEWLIMRRRLAFSGIEEALICAGLMAIAVATMEHRFWSDDAVSATVVGVTLAIAGLRLLNPLFTTLAFATLSIALYLSMDTMMLAVSTRAAMFAGLLCYAMAWIALGTGALRFNRPSYDHMLNWLVIAMPLVGYLWLAGAHDFSAIDYWRDHSLPILLTLLLPLAFGVSALATGIRRRTHAPLIAFMLCVGCVAYELRSVTGLSLEARLIVWGGVLLAAALALDRFLRTPRAGVTSEKMNDGEGALALLELAGTVGVSAQGQQAPERGFKGGGGSFGGGGASGEF